MAGQAKSLDLAVVLPTYVGSILSALGAGFVLICYAFLPQTGHIRHALIINLALAGELAIQKTTRYLEVVEH